MYKLFRFLERVGRFLPILSRQLEACQGDITVGQDVRLTPSHAKLHAFDEIVVGVDCLHSGDKVCKKSRVIYELFHCKFWEDLKTGKALTVRPDADAAPTRTGTRGCAIWFSVIRGKETRFLIRQPRIIEMMP